MYDFDEYGLSRLVVKSLLTASLLEIIFMKFGNDPKFETCPDKIFL